MTRWLQLLMGSVLCVSFLVGCATQGELQALRADIAARERNRLQQSQAVSSRLQNIDSRINSPEANVRRELAQNIAATDELRVEVLDLRGMVQEMQHDMQSSSEPADEMRDIFATKLAELETRLTGLEQRVIPPGQAVLQLPDTEPRAIGTPTIPPQRLGVSSGVPQPPTRPMARPNPSSRPTLQAGVDESVDKLYEKAREEYQNRNYEVAIVLFKQLVRQFPQSNKAGSAQYWLGESLYAQKQYEAAIVAFDEVVQKYTRNVKVPAAILKQGYAFEKLNDQRNARFFLQQVQRKYPDTQEADQAGKRLKTLKN